MKCANCGIELANNAKFCPECGTKAVVENVCSKCGTKLEPSAKFCPECGTKAGELGVSVEKPNPTSVETGFADGTPEETLLQAAEAGDTDAMVKLAELYFNERKFDEIFKWAKKAAEEDCAEGQNWLGLCYVWGWSCSIDLDEAEKWYLKAVERGNEDAMSNLSESYSYAEKYDKCFEWAKKAAEAGSAKGQRLLGDCYRYGSGCDEDLDEAKKWYLKAAEAGNSDAMCDLSDLYFYLSLLHYDGENESNEFKWAKKAAEAGNVSGQISLGDCYKNGSGCVKNLDEAKKWYFKAVEQGSEYAMSKLVVVYLDKKDYVSGFRWAKKAAEAGYDNGQYLLGDCYKNGWGCVKNLDEAKKWYNKAAEQGNEEAIEALNKIQKGIERKGTLKKIGDGALEFLGELASGVVLNALAGDDNDND